MYFRYITGAKIFFLKKGPIPALLKALAQVVPIPALSKALVQVLNQYDLKGLYQRFKSAGIGHMPFPALLKSAGTGPSTLYPHSLRGGLKRWEKKRRDRNFDPIPALFGAIPAVLKTLGQPCFFVVNCEFIPVICHILNVY